MRSCSSLSLTKTLKNVRRHKLAQYRHPNWRNLQYFSVSMSSTTNRQVRASKYFRCLLFYFLRFVVLSKCPPNCLFLFSFVHPNKKKCCCRRPWSSDGGGVIFPSSPTAFLCSRYRDIFVPAAGRESRRSGRASRPTTSIIVVVIVGPLVTMYRRGSLQYRFVPTTLVERGRGAGVGNNRQRWLDGSSSRPVGAEPER